MKNYQFGAISKSDPSKIPLGYDTLEKAQAHCDLMNSIRMTWDANENGLWNKEYWKNQPEEWIVITS